MTQIIINKAKVFQNQISGIKSVSFDFLNENVFSANKVQKLVGVFLSDVVTTDASFIRWNELSLAAQKVEGTDVRIYVKSSTSSGGLLSAQWQWQGVYR